MTENENTPSTPQASATPPIDLSGSEAAAKEIVRSRGTTQKRVIAGAETDPNLSTFQATDKNVLRPSDE